jgi:hypothetical protein
MMRTITRSLAAAGLGILAVAATGCGGDSGSDDSGTGPGPAVVSGFEIVNASEREAWYMYSRACGTQDWGEDELGAANILYPGESVNWEENAGCYDVLALTSLGETPRYQELYEGRSVSAGEATEIDISDDDWTPVQSALVGSLRQIRK